MHLWEYPFDETNCAWIDEVLKAQTYYPQGRIETVELVSGEKVTWFADPIKMFKQMQQTFRSLSKEVADLYNNVSQYKLEAILPRMLELDVSLYGLLFDWYLDYEIADPKTFDYVSYFKEKKYCNYAMYFTPNPHMFYELHESRLFQIGLSAIINEDNPPGATAFIKRVW